MKSLADKSFRLVQILLLPLGLPAFVILLAHFIVPNEHPLDFPYGYTTRVLVDESTGILNYGTDWHPSLSNDGRYVAFSAPVQQFANNVVHLFSSIFIYDRKTGETIPVSVTDKGILVEGHSPMISANGRVVVFASYSNNLSPIDTNNDSDIYIRDLVEGRTALVSMAYNELAADASSYDPTLSADGRYVAFMSMANNLVKGDTNHYFDIFVADLRTGEMRLASVASDGTQANGPSHRAIISGSGRYVAFYAGTSNLAPGTSRDELGLYRHDLDSGETIYLTAETDLGVQSVGTLAINTDGRFVVFLAGRTTLTPNYIEDYGLYLYDHQSGKVDLLVKGLNGVTPNGPSFTPSISADGRYVAFGSYADNLVAVVVPRRDHIYLLDRQTGVIQLISVSSENEPGDGASTYPAISADGQHVAFMSEARNLVEGYVHGALGVFVHDVSNWENYPWVDVRRFGQAVPFPGPYPPPIHVPLINPYPAPGDAPAGSYPGFGGTTTEPYPAPVGVTVSSPGLYPAPAVGSEPSSGIYPQP